MIVGEWTVPKDVLAYAIIVPQRKWCDVAKLVCKNYGFECDFIAEGTDASEVIESFGKHTLEEHGIEYSKEALMQFIIRQGG